ncbi:MAG TPA: DNA repair protein RecO [Mycobacteriales bacterium]|jgi:DNA repair protein RecO (recombination protein O)
MGGVALYRDQAVVLRTQKLGEADRIVTMLTKRHGKVRAVAKGVRRTKSRFGARLEPFIHVDVQNYAGRELDVVTQAEIVDAFTRMMDDYERYTAGTAMLEAAERLTEEREPSLKLYLLLVGGLRALDGGEHAPSLVLDAFLLRALSVSGYEPALDACARCATEGPHRWFTREAGVVCSGCRGPAAASPTVAAVALLSALLSGDWTVADAADTRTRREASGLVSAYTEYHMDRRLRSLAMVER